MVNKEAKKLEESGIDFLVMPCNTMHLFQEEILKGVYIPFISMIDSVVQKVKDTDIRTVGLLGSSTTMTSELYSNPLKKIEINSIVPKTLNHERISQIIQKYIAGELRNKDILFLDQQCKELIKQGAQGIILGCTELPLIMKSLQGKYQIFSSSEILSEETLKYYYKN